MGLYTYDSTPIPKSDRIPKLVENLYAKMPEIESARAVLITESYKQTENEPMIIRRAKAFQHILENIPITIRDLELVVGSSTLAPRGCQTFPEFSYEWLEAEFDTVETRSADPFYISEQTKKELWLQYPDKATYLQQERMLQDILKVSEGMDEVIIYCRKEKAVKRLAKGWNVTADEVLLSRLTNYLGESCVKVIEKPIESVH